MAKTTFSGPVESLNGFIGSITLTDVAATDITASGTLDVTGASTLAAVDATNLTATGVVILSGLPTTDPLVEGQLWSDAGVLTVSAGV